MSAPLFERREFRASDGMPTPVEGQTVQVLYARLGNPNTVGEEWREAEFLGRRGSQYIVRGCTAYSAPHPVVLHVSPESVRFSVVTQ
jgi:hypothetical protein